jgi:hypothetical protein
VLEKNRERRTIWQDDLLVTVQYTKEKMADGKEE